MPDRALGKPALGRRQRPAGIRVTQVRVLGCEQWGSAQHLTVLRDTGSSDYHITDLWDVIRHLLQKRRSMPTSLAAR
jgi:hypothetical protein